jgi:hypothetical protein
VGRFSLGQCMALSIMGLRLVGMVIGMYPLLVKLILRPNVFPNTFNMLWINLIFCICAGVKMVVSSANCRMVVWNVGIKTKRS